MNISHNSHSGFQMQSWRSRRMNSAGRESRAEDGRAGRRVWTTKSWLQGNIHHWACETHTVMFTSLQLKCNGAPCYRGRFRQTLWNNGWNPENKIMLHKREAEKVVLFYIVQMSPAEKMRIYANVTRRWVNVLTSSLKAWAPPSWTADVIHSHAGCDITTANSRSWTYFQNETLCSSWRDRGPRPRRLPEMHVCHTDIVLLQNQPQYRIGFLTSVKKKKKINMKDVLHFNPTVQGLWLRQITD